MVRLDSSRSRLAWFSDAVPVVRREIAGNIPAPGFKTFPGSYLRFAAVSIVNACGPKCCAHCAWLRTGAWGGYTVPGCEDARNEHEHAFEPRKIRA